MRTQPGTSCNLHQNALQGSMPERAPRPGAGTSATKASHHGLLARLAFETITISYSRLTSNMALHAVCMAFSVNIMRSAKHTKRSGHARNESGLAVALPLERLCGGDT